MLHEGETLLYSPTPRTDRILQRPSYKKSLHTTSIPTHPSVYPAPITDPQLVEIHRGPTNCPPSTPPPPPPPFPPQQPSSHPPLPSHNAQMLQHSLIRVQEPLHAIPHAGLLLPVQPARRDGPRNALRPADVGEFVHGWTGRSSALLGRGGGAGWQGQRRASEQGEGGGDWRAAHSWILAFCISLLMDCCRSRLSRSESLSMSTCAWRWSIVALSWWSLRLGMFYAPFAVLSRWQWLGGIGVDCWEILVIGLEVGYLFSGLGF